MYIHREIQSQFRFFRDKRCFYEFLTDVFNYKSYITYKN